MLRTVAQIAKIVGFNSQQLKSWAYKFREFLNPCTNPPKGEIRYFEDSDALAIIFIACWWSNDNDFEDIVFRLDQGDHLDSKYREELYLHTPLLQEPPEGLDETWRHGSLYTPSFFSPFELARNYTYCAEKLLDLALRGDEALDMRSPVMFAYRHALELYLKILGQVDQPIHSLKKCLEAVEKRNKRKMRDPYRSWILELDSMDPGGTAFRYDLEDQPQGLGSELWIDFRHVKFVMDKLIFELDMAILNDRGIWQESFRV